MALSLMLRTPCRASALVSNVSRLGSRPALQLSVRQFLTVQSAVKQTMPSLVKATGARLALRQASGSATAAKAHGGHDKMWLMERILSASLLGVLPAAIMFPSQLGDYLMVGVTMLHTYLGLHSVVVDYVRPIVFGNVIPKIAQGALAAITLLVSIGLIQFIRNDIGVANAIRRFWSVNVSDKKQ